MPETNLPRLLLVGIAIIAGLLAAAAVVGLVTR